MIERIGTWGAFGDITVALVSIGTWGAFDELGELSLVYFPVYINIDSTKLTFNVDRR